MARAAISAGISRTEFVLSKFGGENPGACDPADLVERVTWVIERGVLISHRVERFGPDAEGKE